MASILRQGLGQLPLCRTRGCAVAVTGCGGCDFPVVTTERRAAHVVGDGHAVLGVSVRTGDAGARHTYVLSAN